eukprot:scaffold16381_cov22-Prasinocladus_malaysianus.AAC.1
MTRWLATVTIPSAKPQSTNRSSRFFEIPIACQPSSALTLRDTMSIEYNASYIYHAMYTFFNRDNVALPGMAKFLRASSEEERGHAELLMNYQ